MPVAKRKPGALKRFLATALYLTPDPSQLVFYTLDQTQRSVAKALGFPT